MTVRVLTPQQVLDGEPPVTVAPLMVNTRDAAALLGIGKRKLYELLNEDAFETVHLGRLHLVPLSALTDYVDRLRAQARAAKDGA